MWLGMLRVAQISSSPQKWEDDVIKICQNSFFFVWFEAPIRASWFWMWAAPFWWWIQRIHATSMGPTGATCLAESSRLERLVMYIGALRPLQNEMNKGCLAWFVPTRSCLGHLGSKTRLSNDNRCTCLGLPTYEWCPWGSRDFAGLHSQ